MADKAQIRARVRKVFLATQTENSGLISLRLQQACEPDVQALDGEGPQPRIVGRIVLVRPDGTKAERAA